jgi:hypothetical protein
MTTSTHASKKSTHSNHNATTQSQETTMTTSKATAPATPATTYKVPPAGINIPSPPAGFVPTSGADYRGVMPKTAELAVLQDAVTEIQQCTDFTSIFGRTLPSVAVILGLFNSGAQWSSTRAKSEAFDDYCRTEEGLVWIEIRQMMAKIQPVFTQAVASDVTIGAQFSALGRLLGAQKAIAQRGVATRKANRAAKAKGEPATHGKVAKAKTKAAAKAALAAQNAAEAAATAAPVAASPAPVVAPVATATPVVTPVAAPVATASAPTVSPVVANAAAPVTHS